MKVKSLIWVGIIALVFAACSKSVEGENSKWKSNTKAIADLGLDYPNFKQALDAQLKKAEAIMKEAEGISNEEQKIAKMDEANKALNAEFVRNLKSLKSTKDAVRKLIDDAEKARNDDNKKAVKRAVKDAEKAFDKMEKALKNGGKTESEATAATRQAMTALKDAKTNLDRIIADVKAKAKEGKDAIKQKEKAATDAEKAKTVTCAYCDAKNDAKDAKCKSCGAALAKK